MTVTARRTRLDCAHAVRDRVDRQFPDAERMVLGRDTRNPHDPASRSQAFPPAAAKRRWDQRELHHTPQHGAWRTIAESELSALGRQGRNRHLPDADAVATEAVAWATERNAAQVTIHWPFTWADARIKRARLSPTLESSK